MHPMYDPRGLTDDEILDKLAKLYNMHGTEINYGHDAMASNIDIMIDTLEAEREQRMATAQLDELKKKGVDLTETITIGEIQSDYNKEEK